MWSNISSDTSRVSKFSKISRLELEQKLKRCNDKIDPSTDVAHQSIKMYQVGATLLPQPSCSSHNEVESRLEVVITQRSVKPPSPPPSCRKRLWLFYIKTPFPLRLQLRALKGSGCFVEFVLLIFLVTSNFYVCAKWWPILSLCVCVRKYPSASKEIRASDVF